MVNTDSCSTTPIHEKPCDAHTALGLHGEVVEQRESGKGPDPYRSLPGNLDGADTARADTAREDLPGDFLILLRKKILPNGTDRCHG